MLQLFPPCRYLTLRRRYALYMCAGAYAHDFVEYFVYWVVYVNDGGATTPPMVSRSWCNIRLL